MTSFPLMNNISCTTCTTLLLTIVILSTDVCAKVFYEQRLLTSLLRDYNPRARPVDERDDTIDVNVTFHLTKVVGLDTKDQILQTSGWLQLIWTDSRLTWEPSQYGNIELIAFLPTDVWFPNFALENSAGAFHDFNHHRLFRISARYDGLMVWEPAGSFLTFCPIDVTFYPFDTQTCTLTFVDWVYSDGKVRLALGSDEIYTDATYYQQSGEWRIQKTRALWDKIRYEENNETFSRVSFVVVIHRQYIHYFVNLLFPSFILSFLVLLVYFVPRSMGEKLGMGVTLMMSYFVFNLSVAEDVPKSADHTPLIQVYLVFYMSTTALTIAVTIMMLWLNHTPHVGPPPEWLRFIVYQVFARVICYGKMCGTTKFKNRSKEDEEILEMQMKQGKEIESGVSPAPTGLTASALVEIAKFASTTAALNEDIEETRSLAESKDVSSTDGTRISSVDADIKSKLKSVEKKSKAVLSSLFEAVKKEAKVKSINRIKEEWTEITKIINAFAFCVLFSVTIVFIIVFGILWIIIDFR